MTNKLIDRLEELADELKLIVAQIRKPSTVVEEALSNDIIEFEGKQYKKVDREAREGDVVISNAPSSLFVNKGEMYKVSSGLTRLVVNAGTANVVDLYHNNRTPETVDVYELMDGYNPGIVMADETPIKTANQLRAEMIEKAKEFIEKAKYKGIVNFTVEERSVIAVHQDTTRKPNRLKGAFSNCHPNDVFNEHIGKAIALGRALGLDVSEFEQAVQPNELVVGMEVKLHGNPTGLDFFGKDTFDEVNKLSNGDYKLSKNGKGLVDGRGHYSLYKPQFDSIINDTNAQYGGTE
ncbi:MAG: hypothetical protein ABS944_17780 [Solibacillus sp.]|uniref:hypothetical protein n=1 Tax=Solibacillus sp. TaxID=1909654 RepID=UPI0033154791